MLSKRGQVSDTMTWVVATVIIVVILLSFIFISSILAEAKNIPSNFASKFTSNYEKKSNWMNNKTQFALDINSNNENKILIWIKEAVK